MRNAAQDPYKTFVVLPDGSITATFFGIGVESPYVSYEMYEGKPIPAVKPHAKRAGIGLLEDHYANEDDDEIRAKGYEVFSRWWNGEYGVGKLAADVTGWLPKSVLALRAKYQQAEHIASTKMPQAPGKGSGSSSSRK